MKTAEKSRIQEAKALRAGGWKKDFQQNKALYLIFLPVFIYFFIFHYPVIDRTVDTYIKNLRKKLRLDCIVTVKGIGYKYEVQP